MAQSAYYEINTITNSITATGSLGSPRWEAGGLVMLNHGEVLIAGGVGPEEVALTSCELYDSVRKSWAWTKTNFLAVDFSTSERSSLKYHPAVF